MGGTKGTIPSAPCRSRPKSDGSNLRSYDQTFPWVIKRKAPGAICAASKIERCHSRLELEGSAPQRHTISTALWPARPHHPLLHASRSAQAIDSEWL